VISVPMLAAMALLQGAEVTASVDRTRVRVGEELTLTVRARTRTADPVQIVLPSLNGFAIVGSRDMTEVAINGVGAGGSIRTTIRELQLRAQQAGALLIGPVRARQGASLVSTDPILVTVDSAADRSALALSPLARSLLERAAPPVSRRADRVALSVIVPSDTVLAGQQVDVIAAAWIPRDIGERMRRPPLLTLETPEGVWAYPVATSSGVALSRQVGGRWIDLYIAHQVVFPLVAGRLIIPPASLEYALPVTFSFFSREERYNLRSDSIAIAVLRLPPAPSSISETNVVGESLGIDLQVDPATTRVGEPVAASVTINGIGNVSLWPEPTLRWPAGFRVYPAQTEVRFAPAAGRIAGSKTFHYLAVPDSAGSFSLPAVRYVYYDAKAGRYESAATSLRPVAVAPGAEPRAARVLPTLLPSRGEQLTDRFSRQLGWQGWLALLIVPPLIAWTARRRRRAMRAPEKTSVGSGLTPLGRLEREFLNVLASHVPDPVARDGDGLAPALRAAGVDSAVADHVRRLRDRLRAARYGPRGLGDAAELGAEIQQVLRVLGAETGPTGTRRPHAVVATMILLVMVGAQLPATATVQAQTASAEALFEAGALRAAADSFAARAAREPGDPAHWFNLGATLYRGGADGKAIAAWMKATRLAPRDQSIRRALRLLPAPDPVSEELLRVGWATPLEWAFAAAAGWVLLWLVTAFSWHRRLFITLFGALTAAAVLFGVIEWQRRDQSVAVVIVDAVSIRAAPYGAASAPVTIPAGGALLVGRSYGPWREVRRRDGIHGWVLGEEIAGL
jgi:oxygen tolerance protein BatD